MTDVWESAGVTVERWESNSTPGVVLNVVIRDGDIVASVSDEQLAAAIEAYFDGSVPVLEGDGAGGFLADAYPNPGVNQSALATAVNALIVAGENIETVFDPGPGEDPPSLTISATGGGSGPFLRVALILVDPTVLGGSYADDTWTIPSFSGFATDGDFRLLAVLGTDPADMSAPSVGLFGHVGGGSFPRVQSWSYLDAGTWITSGVEIPDDDEEPYDEGSLVAWLHTSSGEIAYTLLELAPFDATALLAAIAAVGGEVSTLQALMSMLMPAGPVKPNLHVSKYVTFDPDFPLDGTATHVGGQLIENGQNLTILDNSTGNGGVWTLSTSGPATRATNGFGSIPDDWIAQYDHVGFTGTRWAYFAQFRLYGDPITRGMSPAEGRLGIIGGEGVSRSYRPDLIATTLDGDDLTVLAKDGTTTVLSVAAQTGTFCVLVLDTVSMVTIADGAVAQTEDFATADGQWIAQGHPAGGTGAGTEVVLAHGVAGVATGQPFTPDDTYDWENPDPENYPQALDALAVRLRSVPFIYVWNGAGYQAANGGTPVVGQPREFRGPVDEDPEDWGFTLYDLSDTWEAY